MSMGSGGKDTSTIYTLHDTAGDAPARAQKGGRAVLAVARPELPAGFETDRIALYFEKDHRLDYYADAKWSAPLDGLLQDYIIERAKRKLPGIAVGSGDLTASAQYRLGLKVVDFQPVYPDTADKPPRLDVSILVTVLSLPGEKVKKQFAVKKSAPASANRLTIVTNELRGLLQSATDETLEKAAPYISGTAP
jgi:ABC-type uncharacterized transport system auxiliary subunit